CTSIRSMGRRCGSCPFWPNAKATPKAPACCKNGPNVPLNDCSLELEHGPRNVIQHFQPAGMLESGWHLGQPELSGITAARSLSELSRLRRGSRPDGRWTRGPTLCA